MGNDDSTSDIDAQKEIQDRTGKERNQYLNNKSS